MHKYSTKKTTKIEKLLISIAVIFLTIFLLIPLIFIFYQALSQGVDLYIKSITDSEALKAIQLSLITTLIVVPTNIVFGIAIAWLLTRFQFTGKSLLLTLLDLPFSVSPVVAGLMFVLLFGSMSFLGSFLESENIRIIFSTPGIILATLFVTFPFIAKELIPLMEAQGDSEEQASLILGANSWQMFWNVTLPNIKWALIYGIILTNARALGEFGAVSVVSGHIRGKTNTIPLHVEILYNEYQTIAAFSLASLLALIAVLTLLLEFWVNRSQNKT